MTEVERVRRAIAMDYPDRVPIILYNRDFEKSDIIPLEVVHHFFGPTKRWSEFGFEWESLDNTMGHPRESPIREWEDMETYRFPDPNDPGRFDGIAEAMMKYGDKYYAASLSLSGFSVMTFLRGYENALIDLEIDQENMNALADKVFGFEEDVIRRVKDYGFHAVAFFDDWGTQDNLIISPTRWRQFIKPRYKRQFDLCHSLGLDVYFHCCGYIRDILEDFLEIGVDILNISQPNIFAMEELGLRFGGRVCFMCPISYQTTSLSGTREEIFADAKCMIDHLTYNGGGLIGYVEEYESIGLSEQSYQNCIDAFLTQGTGRYGRYGDNRRTGDKRV